MKRILLIILLPLLAAGASALSVWGLQSYDIGIEASILNMLIVAGITFGVSLVLFNYFVVQFSLARFSSFQAGSAQYEREISQRFEALSQKTARYEDIERLQSQIKLLEKQQSFQTADFSISPDQEISNPETPSLSLDDVSDHESYNKSPDDGSKIISLDLTKRPANTNWESTRSNQTASELTRLVESGALKMYLQPMVAIPGRSVPGFEAFARLVHADGRITSERSFMRRAETIGLLPEIDLRILNQAISLLRTLRRKNQTSMIFWNISHSSLQTQPEFTAIADILKANVALKDMLIIEISEDKFANLDKQQLSRLDIIREYGFKISLDNCSGIQETENLAKTGLFSFIKLPVTILEQFANDEKATLPQTIGSMVSDNHATTIVTHVEREEQILNLIDQDISYAQGVLFSEPKAPKDELDTDIIAQNGSRS